MTYSASADHKETRSAQLDGTGASPARDLRRAVLWRADLKIIGRPAIRCVVIDLSSGGAKVQVEKPVEQGALVKLRSQRFTREACVVWSAGDVIGLRFHESGEHLMKTLNAPS
jgi:hypothetical protein